MIFSKSKPSVRVSLVLASSLLALLILQTAAAAQLSSTPQSAHKSPAKRAKKSAKKAPEPAPPPAPPPPPPTLEQMPALPPQVHYNRGQLTIVAENSTLGDILRAVRSQTKAEVEIPPNATERVVGHFGPGPARDVLTALLNGAHFNYVMLGSAAHPDGVERLILTSKSAGGPESPPAPFPAQNNNEAPVDEAATPGPEVEPPTEEAPESSANDDSPPPTPDGQQQVKTPEQLLRELQQQQLLQQQQQQQEPQPGTPPPK